MSSNNPERLQKFLAKYGVASRRKIEDLIRQGEIEVDGQLADLGCKVDLNSEIIISGKKFNPPQIDSNIISNTKLILYHKPIGKICTKDDPEGRDTVYNDLPKLKDARWISIGRLDINTCGLLLFTNNGELANKLMHPSNNYEREYLVRVLGEVTQSTLDRLLNGVELEDGFAKFIRISTTSNEKATMENITNKSSNQWFKVVLQEGRKREVRRLWEAVDCKVNRLVRIRFGPYSLPRNLDPGSYQELDIDDVI